MWLRDVEGVHAGHLGNGTTTRLMAARSVGSSGVVDLHGGQQTRAGAGVVWVSGSNPGSSGSPPQVVLWREAGWGSSLSIGRCARRPVLGRQCECRGDVVGLGPFVTKGTTVATLLVLLVTTAAPRSMVATTSAPRNLDLGVPVAPGRCEGGRVETT